MTLTTSPSITLFGIESNVIFAGMPTLTDEMFDFRSLEPKLGGVEKPIAVNTSCRFGFTKRIPEPDNCVVWARKKGREFTDTVIMLKSGTYTLAVSVGSLQGTPAIALPLAGGRPDRRYPLGRIVVRDAVSEQEANP